MPSSQFCGRAVLFCGLFSLFIAMPLRGQDVTNKQFAAADSDSDKKLTLEEFLKLPGEKAVLKRDFLIFDFDRNQSLSREEFDAVPLGRLAADRGPLPDPIQELVERAMAQIDEAYDNWDQSPQKRITLQDFIQNYLLSFPDASGMTDRTPQLSAEADENHDRRISRDEVLRFLEIQFGVRRSEGDRLRLSNGQVIAYGRFHELDKNSDHRIERQEFYDNWTGGEKDRYWNAADKNRDGVVLFDEFQASGDGFGTDDPVEQFRKYDANLDAYLDAEELLAGSPRPMQNLAKHAFPAFDLDRDGKLSFWEFRQLPQSHLVLFWHDFMYDDNHDEALEFSEFAGETGLFPLARLVYFMRFDLNRNGKLDPAEFGFKTPLPQEFYRLNADGSGRKLVFASRDYPRIGSPKLSRDGQWIACDCVRRGEPRNARRTILIMTVDGKNVREAGPGYMPNWAPDGKHLAFSFSGVQIKDLVTNDARTFSKQGWCAQWSPDGKKIAFSQGPEIRVFDVESEEITSLLNENDNPYQQIHWNMSWSPDSGRLGFKGTRRGGAPEIATINIAGPPQLTVLYKGGRPVENCVDWSPDGKRIIIALHAADRPHSLLHEINPNQPGEPTLVPGLDVSVESTDAAWSPDSSFFIYSVVPD